MDIFSKETWPAITMNEPSSTFKSKRDELFAFLKGFLAINPHMTIRTSKHWEDNV